MLVALGRTPDVTLAREAGLELGSTGAIRVDPYLRTSDPDVYAAGDCVEQIHVVTDRLSTDGGPRLRVRQHPVAGPGVAAANEQRHQWN